MDLVLGTGRSSLPVTGEESMLTGTITSLEDLARLSAEVTTGPRWYRGQADVAWPLVPSIYRPFGKLKNKAERSKAARIERDVYRDFCRGAVAFASTQRTGAPDWNTLFLAQHHGCPTRLLDWSLNVNVAAFFAAAELPAQDGAIWCLHADRAAEPTLRCRQSPSGGYGVDSLSAEIGQPSFMHRRTGDRTKKFTSFVALLDPPVATPRINAQNGRFTIHVSPNDTDVEQDHGECLQAQRGISVLARYTIPASTKARLVADLSRVGVHHRALFPDLDGLGRYMRFCLTEWLEGFRPST